MTPRHLLTLAGVGLLGFTGLALLLPNPLHRWLVTAADRLASELAAAIEDAMDVFEGEVA